MTTLIIHGAQTSEAARLAAASAQGQVVVLEIDSRFDGSAAKVECLHDLIDADDLGRANRFCADFMRSWFIRDDVDYSAWRGRSIGEPSAVEDVKFLIPLLRNAALVAAALERYRPSRILIGEGAGLKAEVWAEEAKRRSVSWEYLSRNSAIKVEPEWSTDPPIHPAPIARTEQGQPLPTAPLRGHGQRIFGALLEIARARTARAFGGPPIVMIGSAPDKARQLLATIGLSRVVYHDRRASFVFLGNPLTHWIDRIFGPAEERRARRYFAGRWEMLDERWSDHAQLVFEGVYIGDHVRDWCRRRMTHDFPRDARTLWTANLTLRAIAPDVMVSKHAKRSNTVTLWSREARERGVGLLVGLTDMHVDTDNTPFFLAPVADRVLASGTSAIRWCEQRGISRDKVTVTGDHSRRAAASKIDAFEPAEVRSIYGIGEGPVILYADSPFCNHDTFFSAWLHRRYLEWVKGLAPAFAGARVVVKFHPPSATAYDEGSEALQRHVDLLRAGSPDNLTILPQRSSIWPLLRIAHVVVTPHSTVGYEAMAVNLPVVFLREPRCWTVPQPFEDKEAATFATTEAELHGACRRILADPAGHRAHVAQAQAGQLERLFAAPSDPWPILASMLAERKARPLRQADARALRRSPSTGQLAQRKLR